MTERKSFFKVSSFVDASGTNVSEHGRERAREMEYHMKSRPSAQRTHWPFVLSYSAVREGEARETAANQVVPWQLAENTTMAYNSDKGSACSRTMQKLWQSSKAESLLQRRAERARSASLEWGSVSAALCGLFFFSLSVWKLSWAVQCFISSSLPHIQSDDYFAILSFIFLNIFMKCATA